MGQIGQYLTRKGADVGQVMVLIAGEMRLNWREKLGTDLGL
jgi:hypothetical protein